MHSTGGSANGIKQRSGCLIRPMGRKIASSKPPGVIAIYKTAPWVPYLTNDAYAAKALKPAPEGRTLSLPALVLLRCALYLS